MFGSVYADALLLLNALFDNGGTTSTCSSLLTSPDPDEYDEHNMWKNTMRFFCHEHIGSFMESYFDEVVLGRIALSCHFALDLLRDKAELYYSPFLRLAFAEALPVVQASVGSL